MWSHYVINDYVCKGWTEIVMIIVIEQQTVQGGKCNSWMYKKENPEKSNIT